MGRIGVATSLRRASGLTSGKVDRYEKTCGTSARGKVLIDVGDCIVNVELSRWGDEFGVFDDFFKLACFVIHDD